MTVARWTGAIGVILLVLGGAPGQAQSSADAFFHEAAQQYVDGDVEAARRTVAQGLEAAPSDPRLRALRKALKQRRTGRGGGRPSQSGQQGQQSDQQSKGKKREGSRSGAAQNNAQSRSGNRQSSDRSSQQSGRGSKTARNSQSASQAQGTAAQRRREGQARRGRPRDALSRAQAEQLLQALKSQEAKLLREIRARASQEKTAEKDW
ncbi:MAG: hypothetical protein ABEL04_04785 [Salinibacter sp.]|uniref:hypothetical protein n=1 Tax=Salinibacter sp. TaxID=2065818 RepID=UPI0035D5140B